MSDKMRTEVRRVAVRGVSGLTLAGGAVGLAVGQGAQAATPMARGPVAVETLWLVGGTEGGEGGEGGAAAVAPDETVGLMVSLMKIEARAVTAADLAAAGDGTAAQEAIHSAKDEIFETIEGALKAHKAPIFEDALLAMGDAIKAGKDAAAIRAARDELSAGLEAARAAIAPGAKDELAAVLALTREAAEDFGAGVKDGKLADADEYRDARGYLIAARAALTRLSGSADPVVKGAAEKSGAALDPVIAALADVAPAGPVTADPGLILAAAARIELAAYPVK